MTDEKMKNNHEEEHCGCGCGCGDNVESDCGCNEEEGCGCGCEDHEHGSMVVDLEDENGNVVACEVVDGFTYKESDYILVQHPEDGSVFLFKVEGEQGELVIPDDAEFDEVSKYYEESLNDQE
jgi:hypothetical protein